MRKYLSILPFLVATPALADLPEISPDMLERIPARYQHILEMSPLNPVTMYLDVDEDQSQQAATQMAALEEPLTLYLNRWGGTFFGGPNNSATNTSSIIQGSSATVTPFSGTETQWTEVRECVADLFSAFRVVVTDIEPTSGDYVEAVVAGSPDQIGMPWGVGGVAPYDPFQCNVIPNAIVYAFADVYVAPGQGSTRALCETTAQELAHAFGLDHELLCSDPMTYLDGCGAKSFQDVYAPCGEFEERECSCGRTSQNSVAEMFEKLGTNDGTPPPPPPNDLENPTVALISPDDGTPLVGNGGVEIVATASDDIGLVLVDLYWEFSDASLPCPGSGGGWSCTREGEVHTWTVEAGLGLRSFQVRARDVMGKTSETELRSVWLSPDGSPAPEDNHAPELRIVKPAEGTVVPANQTMSVIVTASDDTGIAQTALAWQFSDRFFPCPFESRNVTCTQEGSTYRWDINVGEGSRTFWAVTEDFFGNVAETAPRTVNLSSTASNPTPVSNDTYDFARDLECGDVVAVNLAVGQEDWFAVGEVPEGLEVEVVVTGDVASDVSVAAASGEHSSQVVAESGAGEVLTFEPDNAGVRVRVRSSTRDGEAQVTVNCVEPQLEDSNPDPVAGCSSTSVGTGVPVAALAALLFIGLLGRRRRR